MHCPAGDDAFVSSFDLNSLRFVIFSRHCVRACCLYCVRIFRCIAWPAVFCWRSSFPQQPSALSGATSEVRRPVRKLTDVVVHARQRRVVCVLLYTLLHTSAFHHHMHSFRLFGVHASAAVICLAVFLCNCSDLNDVFCALSTESLVLTVMEMAIKFGTFLETRCSLKKNVRFYFK